MKKFNLNQLFSSSETERDWNGGITGVLRGNPRPLTLLSRPLILLFAFLTLGAGQMWG